VTQLYTCMSLSAATPTTGHCAAQPVDGRPSHISSCHAMMAAGWLSDRHSRHLGCLVGAEGAVLGALTTRTPAQQQSGVGWGGGGAEAGWGARRNHCESCQRHSTSRCFLVRDNYQQCCATAADIVCRWHSLHVAARIQAICGTHAVLCRKLLPGDNARQTGQPAAHGKHLDTVSTCHVWGKSSMHLVSRHSMLSVNTALAQDTQPGDVGPMGTASWPRLCWHT
jgi:hypothetical protein